MAAIGLLNAIDSLGVPWDSLLTTLLMALLALAFFAAAQRSHDKRMGWLLSASVATGLTIAYFYTLINTAAAAAGAAAVLIAFIAVLPFVVRDPTRLRPRHRRQRRPCNDPPRKPPHPAHAVRSRKPAARRRAA